MTQIPDSDWHLFNALKDDHECDERCFNGVFKNPIAVVSDICNCTHDQAAHWKGKKCRAYACVCMKFVPSED